MLTFTYPALFEAGEFGRLVVTFPDVPEAITDGTDRADAMAQAADALGLALLTYLRQGRARPDASPLSPKLAPGVRKPDLALVSVAPDVAAKLAVLEAFQAAGISKTELARRIDRDEKEVRRILDPMHPTKLPALQAALSAMGRRLVVGVEMVEAA